jgi:hypothetical protein
MKLAIVCCDADGQVGVSERGGTAEMMHEATRGCPAARASEWREALRGAEAGELALVFVGEDGGVEVGVLDE